MVRVGADGRDVPAVRLRHAQHVQKQFCELVGRHDLRLRGRGHKHIRSRFPRRMWRRCAYESGLIRQSIGHLACFLRRQSVMTDDCHW